MQCRAIEIYRGKVRKYHLLGQGKCHFTVVNETHLSSDVVCHQQMISKMSPCKRIYRTTVNVSRVNTALVVHHIKCWMKSYSTWIISAVNTRPWEKKLVRSHLDGALQINSLPVRKVSCDAEFGLDIEMVLIPWPHHFEETIITASDCWI